MKQIAVIAFIAGLMLLMSISGGTVVAAKSLQVHKSVQESVVRVGEEVTIMLKFKNPFTTDIPVRIRDRNILGNNGLDIRCLEYTVPANAESVLYEDPIVPFKSGKYNLDAANVTYINPDTGKSETIESNRLEVVVLPNGTARPNQEEQGITTIYRCNGTDLRYTSYTSIGGGINIQIGGYSPSYVPGGQQSSIEKRMTNNQIEQNPDRKALHNVIKREQERNDEIMRKLTNNKQFQHYDKQLRDSGFNQTQPSFYRIAENHTEITIPYRKNGEERVVKAEYINGSIKNVSISGEPEEGQESAMWWFILIPVIAILAIAGWLVYDRYIKRKPAPVPVSQIVSDHDDYNSEAIRMIDEAEQLFRNGQEKEAYVRVSQAVRYYFANKLGIRKELLNTELMQVLDSKIDADSYNKVRKCLDLCGRVEFARYKPNREDFEEIIATARDVLK